MSQDLGLLNWDFFMDIHRKSIVLESAADILKFIILCRRDIKSKIFQAVDAKNLPISYANRIVDCKCILKEQCHEIFRVRFF